MMSMLFATQKDQAQFAEDLAATPSDPNAFTPGVFSGPILSQIPKGLARGALKTKQALTYTSDNPDDLALNEDLANNPLTADMLFMGQNISVQSLEQAQIAKQWDKELAPDPITTGWAGQTLNTLFDVGGRAVAGTVLTGSPAGGAVLAGGTEARHTYGEALDKGVDERTAFGQGLIEGAATGLGVVLPMSFGAKYLRNILAYGPAANIGFGALSRGATHEWLDQNGYHDLAEQYQWLDAKAMAADYVLGAFFGGLGAHHAGKVAPPLPSDVDAALAANSHIHTDLDTAPGIPADTASLNAHVEAMKTALDQSLNGKEVNVEPILKDASFIDKQNLDPEAAKEIIEGALRDAGYHDLVDELNRMPTEEAAALGSKETNPEAPAIERRVDVEGRKTVAAMTPEELKQELLTHELTGIPNRRAYDESSKKPIQIAIDADSLKWINDNMGHESGDLLLKAVAKALHEESAGNAYHLSGDEFALQADSPEHANAVMAKVQDRLKGATLEALAPDGTILRKTNVEVSHGQGKDLKTADQELQRSKLKRESEGSRSARGTEPPGVARISPEGKPTHEGRTPEQPGVTSPESITSIAEQAIAENLKLEVTTETGNQSAADSLRAADEAVTRAETDARGFMAAVDCLLRHGG